MATDKHDLDRSKAIELRDPISGCWRSVHAIRLIRFQNHQRESETGTTFWDPDFHRPNETRVHNVRASTGCDSRGEKIAPSTNQVVGWSNSETLTASVQTRPWVLACHEWQRAQSHRARHTATDRHRPSVYKSLV